MKLDLLHLYPDSMNLYGEYANLLLLRRRLETMGAEVSVTAVTAEDIPDFSTADLIYMGAGTELAQKAALLSLAHHAGGLKAALDRGALLLFTGNAMEALGVSVTDRTGKVWPALGLAAFTTVETEKRVPGDVIARCSLLDTPVVGFMNKCSHTAGVTSPLFPALTLGEGNEVVLGAEGYAGRNILATHITGPVLVKNPALTDLVITRLFEAKGWPLPKTIPHLPHEDAAYAVTLRELQNRIKD